jgi:hypothetical protein
MPRTLILALLTAIMSGCATTTTAVAKCDDEGCDRAPSVLPEIKQHAAPELQCSVEQLQIRDIGRFPPAQETGPWEVRGCGRAAVYHYRYFSLDEGSPVWRNTPIVNTTLE